MKTDSVSNIRLTKKKNQVCYRKYPKNPVFECRLNSNITQKLITDPGSIMKEKTKHRSFWLMLLMHSIISGGQFVFETFPPSGTNNQQNKLAVRTLFQLDGDLLLKIDENILARTDGIDIIKAHLSWTNWCFEQLKEAISFTRILRYVQWLLYIIAVLPFGCGVVQGVTEPAWWLLVILGGIILVYIARNLISVCLKLMIGTVYFSSEITRFLAGSMIRKYR